jgi:uncharacterized protein DUF6069
MPRAPEEPAIDRRRILWAGPLTIAAAVAAVQVVRAAALATLSLPPEGFQPFGGFFPVFDTLVLVSAAVIVFTVVAGFAKTPVRTYGRIALVALVLSMIPDLLMHARRPNLFTWPRTSVLMIMHVVAWWITVTMLAKLTACSKSAD